MKYCSKCGRGADAAARFCEHCGQAFAGEMPRPQLASSLTTVSSPVRPDNEVGAGAPSALRKNTDAPASQPPTFESKHRVHLYEEPSTSSPSTTYAKGTRLTLEERIAERGGTGWWRVRDFSGRTGFLLGSTQASFEGSASHRPGIRFLKGWINLMTVVNGLVAAFVLWAIVVDLSSQPVRTRADTEGLLMLMSMEAYLALKIVCYQAAGRLKRWGVNGVWTLTVIATIASVAWTIAIGDGIVAQNFAAGIEAFVFWLIIASRIDRFS